MNDLLTHEETVSVIWDVGVHLESESKEINQAERFKAIAQAQSVKTKKGLMERLESKNMAQPSPHRGLKLSRQDWQKFQKEVEDG